MWPLEKRVPVVLQYEAVECGAACLSMVLKYYGRHISLEQAREECKISKNGSKANYIIAAAQKNGLEARGLRRSVEDLKKLQFPLILFWQFNHFVVLKKIKKNNFYINDPALGERVVSSEEFSKSYTGIILELRPGANFIKSKVPYRLIKIFGEQLSEGGKTLFFLMLLGSLTGVLLISLPAFFDVFSDEVLLFKFYSWVPNLLRETIFILIVLLIISVSLYYVFRKIYNRVAIRLMTRLVWNTLRLPIQFFEQRFAENIAVRSYHAFSIAGIFAHAIFPVVALFIPFLFFVAVIFQYSVSISIIVVVFLILYSIMIYKMDDIENEKKQGEYSSFIKLNGTIIAGIRNLEFLKSMSIENNFFMFFNAYQVQTLGIKQKKIFTRIILEELIAVFLLFPAVLLFGLGGYQVMRGALSIGSLAALWLIISFMSRPIKSWWEIGKERGTMSLLYKSLMDINTAEHASIFKKKTNDFSAILAKKSCGLNVCNVTFGYDKTDAPLLKNLSFSIVAGSTVAIVGSSGSGKSTLAKIICGLYSPWEGEVQVEGVSQTQLSREVITSLIGYVEQEPPVFMGTIRENITFFDSAINEEKIIEVSKKAYLHDMIIQLPDGYDTIIQDMGSNLNAEQLASLEFARVMAKGGAILVLDEAFKSISPSKEQAILKNIKATGATCIIISHQLSAIRDVDEIIVLENGEIAQRGSHAQLLGEEGLYRELVENELLEGG